MLCTSPSVLKARTLREWVSLLRSSYNQIPPCIFVHVYTKSNNKSSSTLVERFCVVQLFELRLRKKMIIRSFKAALGITLSSDIPLCSRFCVYGSVDFRKFCFILKRARLFARRGELRLPLIRSCCVCGLLTQVKGKVQFLNASSFFVLFSATMESSTDSEVEYVHAFVYICSHVRGKSWAVQNGIPPMSPILKYHERRSSIQISE